MILDDLRRLIEVESPSDEPEALRRCAEELDAILRERLGVGAEIDADANVRWSNGASDSAPPVLILGHLDTVWPLGTLDRLPFSVQGDRVSGPGTFDMKGGLVAAIHAMAQLQAAGELPAVRMLVTSDEETGSLRSRGLVEEEAQRCRRVLVPEPCGPDGAIKTARKGVALGRVVAQGRASHAGLAPHEGINAVLGLGAVLEDIAALADDERGTTVTPTVFRGGNTVNTVPAEATVQLDVRFLDDRELRRLRDALNRLQAPNGVELEAELLLNRPALTEAASAALLPALRAAAAEAGQELRTMTVGGASDGNLAAAVGAAVLDGLGPEGDGAHAEHEHVTVRGLERRVALLAALIPRVAVVEVP
ncbi:MAG: M20/M25/M40 family metallo-hydrolase [Nitriliruptorales bacterium]|nr:M20/M25/M40 family metallo-hydrolase [Nitriliruptorales bacterium]